MYNLKWRNRFEKFSPVKIFVLILLSVAFIASLFFAVISYKADSGISIGTVFPSLFTFMLLFITSTLDMLKDILKYFFKPVIALFYGGAALILATFIIFCILILNYTYEKVPDNVDAIIILGCRTFGMTPGRALMSRLDSAIEFAENHRTIKGENSTIIFIVSGGQGRDETVPEAVAMRGYLMSKGIPSEQIYVEENSHSTFQNLSFSKELIKNENLNLNNIVIVTNEYHIPRSIMIANRLKLNNVYAYSAPSPSDMFGSGIMREYFAYVKSFLLDK